MALPWPHGTPTLPRPVRAVSAAGEPTSLRMLPSAAAARVGAAAQSSPFVARIVACATSPVTALVVMLAGLTLLFVLPLVGLPFVALVVLPAVVFHLRAERRTALRRPRG